MKKFTAYITLRDGTVIYARDYGKRAFVIETNSQKEGVENDVLQAVKNKRISP